MSVKMGCLTNEQKQAFGPKSATLYIFQPWADVEDRDVEEFRSYRYKKGCECNGSPVTFEAMFATEEDILAGRFKPVWQGRYGTSLP